MRKGFNLSLPCVLRARAEQGRAHAHYSLLIILSKELYQQDITTLSSRFVSSPNSIISSFEQQQQQQQNLNNNNIKNNDHK